MDLFSFYKKRLPLAVERKTIITKVTLIQEKSIKIEAFSERYFKAVSSREADHFTCTEALLFSERFFCPGRYQSAKAYA